jgi:hypothetical protein
MREGRDTDRDIRAHACTCARDRGVTYLLFGCFELLLHLLLLGRLRVVDGRRWMASGERCAVGGGERWVVGDGWWVMGGGQ